jgi:hypothetical protein
MAYSCTMIDIPDELRARLAALVMADEDIGHRPDD